MDHDVKSIVS